MALKVEAVTRVVIPEAVLTAQDATSCMGY